MSKSSSDELIQYYGTVYRYAISVVRDLHAADEITQETLRIAIDQGIHRSPEDPTFPVRWMIGIARNLIRSRRRSERKGFQLLAPEITQDFIKREQIPITPDHVLLLEEYKSALADCFEALSKQDKAILKWRFYEGLKLATISSRLGVATTSGWRKINRAVQKLKLCLNGKGYDDFAL